ncbi:chalcone isomerase family protein [Ottowia beijingensis]|nr:chalcone isomerase family protein [Ottowia beijingensis]
MHMQQAGVRFLPHLVMAWMLAGALLAAVPRGAQAAEVEGVKLAEQISVAGQPLVLNGAGTRYRAVFKVYVAGLYLPRKTHSVDEILKVGAEPRRLQLTMLRDIDAAEFGKMFYRGMEDNMDRNAFAKLVPGVMRMSQVFTDFKRNKAGDVIDIDWVPGTGMTIHVNGKSAGEPFKEPEFFAALMRIWLGTKPPDWKLKDALLGKAEGAAS